MCGISGYICAPRFKAKIDNYNLQKLESSIARRGPDGSGSRALETSQAIGAFFHSRLAIVDLSEASDQPIQDSTYGNTLTFNGEIYNYKELAKSFDVPEPFQNSDTLVLYFLLSTHSLDRVLQAIDGMFAFAFFDRKEDTVTLVRDRFGEKPLYHSSVDVLSNDVFFFSSDLSSFHCQKDKPKKVSILHARQFVDFGYTLNQQTILEGVEELKPGTCLSIDLKKGLSTRTITYFSLNQGINESEAGDTSPGAEVIKAVESSLTSDVEVGSFLSGGLDSTLVTAIASVSKPITCFTLASGPDDWDSQQAQKNSFLLGLKHHIVPLDYTQLETQIEAYFNDLTEPMGDDSGFLVQLVASSARRRNIKVLLGGDAGDEIFFGYPRMFSGLRLIESFKFLHGLRFKKTRKKRSKLGKFWDLNTTSVEEFYLNYFLNQSSSTWYHYAPGFTGTVTEIIRKIELELYLSKNNFKKLDFNTMMHGVEGRTPFATKTLLNAVKLTGKVDPRSRRSLFYSILANEKLGVEVSEHKSGFGIKNSASLLKHMRSNNLGDNRLKNFFNTDRIEQLFNLNSFAVNFRLRSLAIYLSKLQEV